MCVRQRVGVYMILKERDHRRVLAGRRASWGSMAGRPVSFLSQRKHFQGTREAPSERWLSILDWSRSWPRRAFPRSSATTLQTLELRKTLNECPGALEVAKTKHLCPEELELGPPLPLLSHGKWEHQQLGGASVILGVWLSAPLPNAFRI